MSQQLKLYAYCSMSKYYVNGYKIAEGLADKGL